MARGRKRKQAKREPNGKPSRKGQVRMQFDHGTARAKLKFDQYGTDGADAIGRAYQAGLLGENADAIRDTARKIARAYYPMMEVGPTRCALNDNFGDPNDNSDHERIKARETWLSGILRSVDAMSREHRRSFDELVIDRHPDSGPPWLERLIYARKHSSREPLPDLVRLELAMHAIARVMS
jgi:hypothetical protein